MYNNNSVLALIPARGGSKGIKNKNIVDLNGHPLIFYTIDSALKSKYIDSVVVSTDSEIIANVAKQCGALVPFIRPAELAMDTSKTIDAVLHAIEALKSLSYKYDVLVLLQPTQPLRDSNDIDGAIELFYQTGLQGVASVSHVDDNPILIRTIKDEYRLIPLLDMSSTCRRQDMPRYFKVNGCVYVNLTDRITADTSFNDNPIGYVMESSHSVDIDAPKDLALAEFYLKKARR